MNLSSVIGAFTDGSVHFAQSWVFWLAVLPLLAVLLPKAQLHNESSLKIPFFKGMNAALKRAGAKGSIGGANIRWWRLLIAIPAWFLLVTAAAKPQLIGEPVNLPVSGRDLMLAVDLSGSMQEMDMRIGKQQVDRLTAVRAVAGEFIQRREGDRLGLILFADRAYLQAPLTFDHKTVNTLLQEAVLGLAGEKTAIGDAIGLSVKRLRESAEDNRVLILLTDGANTAGSLEPSKAAELAAQENIRIHTIGVGAGKRTINDPFFGKRTVATNELDETALKHISQLTGGQYFRARDIRGLQEIYDVLDEIEPVSDEDAASFRPVSELYSWPLAAAFSLAVLLALGLILQSFVPRVWVQESDA